eukprot:342212_1
MITSILITILNKKPTMISKIANLSKKAQKCFNTRTLISNLLIIAIVYLMLTAIIIYYHKSPVSDHQKYTSAQRDNNVIIYNYDKYCSRDYQKHWKSLSIYGDQPFEKYVSNLLHEACGTNILSKQSIPSLTIIVIIDPLHWINLHKKSKHSNIKYQYLTNTWNKYYNDILTTSKTINNSFIVIRYEDVMTNTNKMFSKLCKCQGSKSLLKKQKPIPAIIENSYKCSIIGNILFLIFRSSIQDKGIDGRDIILRTWGKRYLKCDLHMKFVNTMSQKFNNDSNDKFFHDVIQPPFEAESGMSLLWVINQYANDFEWVFKVDDVTYVLMENLLNYLIGMDRYKNKAMWWLGNRLQTSPTNKKSVFTSGGAGYLMNRVIIERIINDINEKDKQVNDKYGQYKKLCGIKQWEDLCISHLLNDKYNVIAANTIDNEGYEKFNVWDPMSIFGYGGIYKLPVDWYAKYKKYVGQNEEKVGYEYITKMPITFHYIKPAWMNAYFELFRLDRSIENIQVIAKRIGKHKDRILRLKHLKNYAKSIRKISKLDKDRIKDVSNELISVGLLSNKGDQETYMNVSWIMDRYHAISDVNLNLVSKLVRRDIVNVFGYQFKVDSRL